jgi:hypothetical protein
MVVRFIPTRGGLRNATLRLTTNAANEQVFEFAVAGEGDIPDPEINVQGNGLDIMDGDPVPSLEDHTDFGSIDVNDGGVTRTFTIQNTGELTLEVAGVQLIGGDNDQFALVSPPASRVFPAQETTFDIEFDPDRTGTHLTTIRITNSDLGKATYDFVIRGTATTAKPQLTLIGNEQPIAPGDDTPATRDGTRFPSTDVGATATHSFTIVNSGAAPLSIANIVFLGSHAADFSASGVPASAIAPATAATFQVTFNPSSLGPRTATLRINSNDPDFPAYRLDLLGTGGNFKLIRIEKDDRDAIVHFLSNPDTDVSTYIYTIRHSTNLSTWTTVGSLLSPGARAEQFRHLDGYLERTGYWHILETVIPLNE